MYGDDKLKVPHPETGEVVEVDAEVVDELAQGGSFSDLPKI
jgi:hypothetical protein